MWAASLEAGPAALAELAATLSPAELERAARFHFEGHRNRFVAGRGLLRTLLGRCLEADPRDLDFAYGPNGKPSLAGAFGDSGLHFNLAHSEDLALVAITRAARVGVDVERVRSLPDAAELVVRFFSKRESEVFRKLPAERQPAAFFNLWTRKEAWLKATGEGIGHLLSQVEVSFLPGDPARLLSLPKHPAGEMSWSLQDLVPKAGFVAAMALAVRDTRLCCWRWEPESETRKLKAE